MTIKNLNINTSKIKDLKKGFTALTLATTMILSGCGKKQDDNTIGFKVENDNIESNNGVYSYILDRHSLESDKYDFQDLHDGIVLAKVDKKEEYDSSLFNGKTSAYFAQNLQIVMPDIYTGYNFSYLGSNVFDMYIEYEYLTDITNDKYTVINSSITAKKDIHGNFSSTNFKQFKKGDNISSTAIYYNNELVAFKQYGVGSECQNVIDSEVGDVEKALSTVEELKLLDETKNVKFNEMIEYNNELNKKEHEKQLVLK